MDEGMIIYYGEGRGKSSAALGFAVRAVGEGKSVYIIRFLKEQVPRGYLAKLEPECKLFRFERSACGFDDMTLEQREEEKQHLKNGIAFLKKVLVTGECEFIVLDEVLGAVSEGMIDADALIQALELRSPEVTIIMTGRVLPDRMRDIADYVFNISDESSS